MSKETFDRSKPHVNIGTIGHVDHGKTTLTAALGNIKDLYPPQVNQGVVSMEVYSQLGNYNNGNNNNNGNNPPPPGNGQGLQEKERGITINTTHLEYESKARHYTHVDCPGHADYVKNVLTGAVPFSNGLVVVNPFMTDDANNINDDNGQIIQETMQQINLALKTGLVKSLIFAFVLPQLGAENGVLVGPECAAQIASRETHPDFLWLPTNNANINHLDHDVHTNLDSPLCIDADAARFYNQRKFAEQLFEQFDIHTRPNPHLDDAPSLGLVMENEPTGFLIPEVEDEVLVAFAGIDVLQGTFVPGQEVELWVGSDGSGGALTAKISDFGMSRKVMTGGIRPVNYNTCNQDDGLLGLQLRGIEKSDIKRGMVIAKPGSVRATVEVEAFVVKEEYGQVQGGKHRSVRASSSSSLYELVFATGRSVVAASTLDMAETGQVLHVRIQLENALPLSKGFRFAIREGGRTVGAGQVTEIVK